MGNSLLLARATQTCRAQGYVCINSHSAACCQFRSLCRNVEENRSQLKKKQERKERKEKKVGGWVGGCVGMRGCEERERERTCVVQLETPSVCTADGLWLDCRGQPGT